MICDCAGPQNFLLSPFKSSVSRSLSLTSSLSASIWKINCQPGHIVRSAEEVLVVLEAMKTEIGVEAGDENIGRTVKGFGGGVKPGALVKAGDVLVVFE